MTRHETFVDFAASCGVDLGAAAARPGPLRLSDVWREGRLGGDELARLVAAFHDLPRLDVETLEQARFPIEALSLPFLREAHLLPLDAGTGLRLAVADPGDRDSIAAVNLALGQAPPLCVLSIEELDLLFARLGRERSIEARPTLAGVDVAEPDTIEALQDLARGAPVVRAIDGILERALDSGATDIHFETGREELQIRLRVDGLLRLDQVLPKSAAPAVISRVKILANLDISERRLPQDGRAAVMIRNTEADLRVAVMPTMYGETAVCRILLKDAKLLDFARIGMSAAVRGALERLLAEPHGVLIVTGPTGSGKTTTLATAISLLNQPTRKIVTVEDPIEYQLPGIHQTQIKPAIGLTFATALRSFLRHDPDVIMVGEMRDGETAQIGIQAALTGHLVLTTLHTNSAVDAVVRLADMGVEPFLIAASLRGVVGQRLVRRLCERCHAPDPEQSEAAAALCRSRNLPLPTGMEYRKAMGCPACGQTGFRGRIGVFEVVAADSTVRSLIGSKADAQALLAAARQAGTTTMLEDGLDKAARGQTTVGEILRVCG
ncbi:GspE/PulE family protein [Lichenifustis flavocetrariae]|uniref:GspE/PulE family protein n=1 Tax=Lichenifustis flavocetrariae TaxID=2949735 RepID=A0AA41Z027_9HYPH|nr:GspE/PulE family protein [Lichenifustis flavocetrariae]MCW6510288.1 GspE/PulE family protein [Lichenifustis flavocetrariae]